MMIRRRRCTLAPCLLFILAAVAPLSVGETHGETPFQAWQPVPASGEIAEPGNYYLDRDLAVQRETGVKIKADDVVLDLRGRVLSFADDPRKGTFGIAARQRKGITVRNGTIRGFWFNIHATDCQSLSIENVKFDDIVYLAVNCARGRQVAIRRCTFAGFRYDVPKPKDKYLVGVNLGGEDVVIAQNTFNAVVPTGEIDVETVFVLLSARVPRRCIVSLNEMRATRYLGRSYGVWIATGSRATVSDNQMLNLKYGITAATNAELVANHNHIEIASPNDEETLGISAAHAKSVSAVENTYRGLKVEQKIGH